MSAHLEIQDQQKPRAKQSCGRCSQCGCQRQQGMSDLAALRVAVSEAMMQLRQANVALNRDDAVRDLVQAIKTAPFEQAFYGTPL